MKQSFGSPFRSSDVVHQKSGLTPRLSCGARNRTPSHHRPPARRQLQPVVGRPRPVTPLELLRRLKQFHRIPIWVFGQYLLTPAADNDVIAKVDTSLFHLSDTRGQVFDFDNEPVPSAGLWPSSVRHRASS